MISGDNKQDLQGFCIFYDELWKYIDDAVDEAFRVIPASRQTGPWSHHSHLGYSGLPSQHWPETFAALHWRHNGCDGVSNHQPHECLLKRLFRRR